MNQINEMLKFIYRKRKFLITIVLILNYLIQFYKIINNYIRYFIFY